MHYASFGLLVSFFFLLARNTNIYLQLDYVYGTGTTTTTTTMNGRHNTTPTPRRRMGGWRRDTGTTNGRVGDTRTTNGRVGDTKMTNGGWRRDASPALGMFIFFSFLLY
jgi:hypothetical protein